MHGQRIGYVRVSSFDQNPERQLETACRVRGAVDGFPPLPPPLGNRYAIPTVPQPRRRRFSPLTKGTLLLGYPGGHFYWALTSKLRQTLVVAGLAHPR